ASPGANSPTPDPTASTTPEMSDPRVSGRGCGSTLRPARIRPSHGPTPAALTRTRISPSSGLGTSMRRSSIASGGPDRWIRPRVIVRREGEAGETDDGGDATMPIGFYPRPAPAIFAERAAFLPIRSQDLEPDRVARKGPAGCGGRGRAEIKVDRK